MTKLRQEDDAYAAIRDLRNRVRKLEQHAPQAIAFQDANSHTRVVIGALDVLGGGYVGKYGWVVLDSTGAVVSQQYA